MSSRVWTVAAVFALALGAWLLVMAWTVMPTGPVAAERGAYGPWVLTWGMIWATVLCAVAIAGFLFSAKQNRG